MSALGKLFKILGSAKLALALIFLVLLFSLIGVIIPQQNATELAELQIWQAEHPGITKIAEPIGLFTVFTSWLFIIILIALAVNTFTCTISKFSQEGGFGGLTKTGGLQKIAFLLLHISIITLIAGGAWSAAARTDAQAILTEGQNFKGTPQEFLRFNKGPLAGEYKQDFVVTLEDVQTEFHGHRLMDVISSLVFIKNHDESVKCDVKVNYPFNYQGLAFTQDKTGYSVLLDVTDMKTRRQFTAMVVLKTFDEGGSRAYSNYFKRAFMQNEIMVTLYPGHSKTDGKIVKTSEQPENPILFMEKMHQNEEMTLNGYLPLEDRLTLGDYEFEFLGLRKWASFRVSKDPGYMTVCVALWLGLAALLLRYAPDFLSWFRKETITTESDSIE